MKKALLVGFMLGMLAACSRPESRNITTRAPTPSSPMADAYDQEIQADDTSEVRIEVRRQVMDYLKNTHPKWQVKGLSLTHYEGDPNYYVGADISEGSTSSLVQLKVWAFIDGEGKTYRKVVEVEGQ